MPKFMPRHERFIEEYKIDDNAEQAAIRAGYAPRSARNCGYRLLKVPHVRDTVAKFRRRVLTRCEQAAERLFAETIRIAFVDLRHAFDEGGALKPLAGIDDETLVGLSIVESSVYGRPQSRVETRGKQRALKLLVRHLGHIQKIQSHTA